MQLLEVVLYDTQGRQRTVEFRPGALNIVTGVSSTGKSALLDIVEYCLGRNHLTVPAGPIADLVQWYAVLLQLPGVRAFVARPRPRPGQASTSRAMLELGADLRSLPMTALIENTDTGSVREQLGQLSGIEENRHEPPTGSLRHPLAAHLGHAALLCFQGQGEVANRALLFHRQGEEGMAQTLRDTIPYFLGAVAADQTVRRLQLVIARRDLRRAETDLANAERQAESVDAQVQALLDEAYSSGLVPSRQTRTRDEALRLLRLAVERPSPEPPIADDAQVIRRRELEAERTRLRQELRAVADQRSLLVEEEGSEEGYVTAVEGQLVRLGALDLIPTNQDGHEAPNSAVCPVCGGTLEEPDLSRQQLGDALGLLRRQLAGVRPARPRREAALRELDDRAHTARQQLRALDAALTGLASGDRLETEAGTEAEERAFRRGRIDASLSRLRATGEPTRARAQAVELARRAVTELEELLDPDTERERNSPHACVSSATT